MDDLISRQDAIDAIKRAIWDKYIAKDVIDAICNVPSAQPEIIRCKDCVSWNTSWKPVMPLEGAYWCSTHDIYMLPDDYCSMAERREE